MISRKHKSRKARKAKPKLRAPAAVIQKAIDENPEVRLVLEIAMRARDAESKEPPLDIGMATDIVATPTNSQCPVGPVIAGLIQTT
jgi:hypothetical protein